MFKGLFCFYVIPILKNTRYFLKYENIACDTKLNKYTQNTWLKSFPPFILHKKNYKTLEKTVCNPITYTCENINLIGVNSWKDLVNEKKSLYFNYSVFVIHAIYHSILGILIIR